ncbi:MAG: NADH-quinone oxidoreductase subunit NuoE [Dehalococcoidales bacterium]|nr:NADH-quinone oxidoreductase subunit NuoE [Dehalococcoidales bacterium]MDP7676153.1 NADH-quinone oxidoreductase subunit NuoE [Dehalococcoidales bacterium]HJM36676.1 NADH-quinone oxidoreductase subunit NuoE [Dehalococcoidales bacterium]
MTKIKTQTISPQNENILIQLKRVESQFGYIPEESITEVAQSLDLPISEIYGVATFYSFLATKPLGRNVIWVCQNLPCHLKHAETTIDNLERILGIKPGETTSDNKFSLKLTNCIGACDYAPAMLINHDLHGNLTPNKISQILKLYK